jgi:hypothetical protein
MYATMRCPYPKDGQNNSADFLLLRVRQDVGQDRDDAEPKSKKELA